MIKNSEINAVFFGTPETAVEIFDSLLQSGIIPKLVVTNPDKPQGRNLVLSPSPVKIWATKNNLPIFQPESLRNEEIFGQLSKVNCQLFIVVAYGGIIPKKILEIPKHGSINVHYSLLPKYRGASPVEFQILNDDKNAGVSIMLLDEKMDHGPIIAQREIQINENKWPPKTTDLRAQCNIVASELLIELLPKFIAGEIKPKPQDHTLATYTKKITSEDREIKLEEDPYKNFLKIQAYETWGTYFFVQKNDRKVRVKINDAKYENSNLSILRVTPEGKKEMSYADFLKGTK